MTPQHAPSAPKRRADRRTPEHDRIAVHAGSAGAGPRDVRPGDAVSAIGTTGVPAPARWMRSYANSRWAALPVLMAGTFMIVMDFFIVNVALPSIQAGSAREQQCHRMGGRRIRTDLLDVPDHRRAVGDHIGRRRTFWRSGCCCSAFLGRVRRGPGPGPHRVAAARAGPGGGADRTHRAVHHRCHLHGSRPGPGDQRVRHGDRAGRGRGPADRWDPDAWRRRGTRLAADVPDQRAGRHRRSGALTATGPREPGRLPAAWTWWA